MGVMFFHVHLSLFLFFFLESLLPLSPGSSLDLLLLDLFLLYCLSWNPCCCPASMPLFLLSWPEFVLVHLMVFPRHCPHPAALLHTYFSQHHEFFSCIGCSPIINLTFLVLDVCDEVFIWSSLVSLPQVVC